MTGPTSTTSTTKPSSTDRPAEDQAGRLQDAHEQTAPGQTVPDGEVRELARTQDDVAQRARRLVAGELTTSDLDGDDERRRADRLLGEARAAVLADLRDQEQERARRQVQEAARSGEDAVAGVVQSSTTTVRGIVPAALVRPEDVIEATFALADQGLRVAAAGWPSPCRAACGAGRPRWSSASASGTAPGTGHPPCPRASPLGPDVAGR